MRDIGNYYGGISPSGIGKIRRRFIEKRLEEE